jgi:uncharacterized protein (TIGR02246 family)
MEAQIEQPESLAEKTLERIDIMTTMPKRLLCLSALLLSGAVHAADTAQDLKAMHGIEQSWMKAYNAGDAEAIAALYADDALLMPPNQPGVSGKAAIRSHFIKEVAAAKKEGLVVSGSATPDGATNGDLGWEAGTYTVKDKSGRVLEAGKYLSVFRKADGKWRYVRDIWNADSAPAPK